MGPVILYHISEQPGIRVFEPRPVENESSGVKGSAVWAIDEEHLPNYLLPRDCPRVTYFVDHGTTEADAQRFFGGTHAKRIIAVETGWFERITRQRLYRYEFGGAGFGCVDTTAGYYVSRTAVTPVKETAIDDPLSLLVQSGVELRVTPLLWRLREQVIHSTLGYSIIRMRNAEAPPEGAGRYHPLPE